MTIPSSLSWGIKSRRRRWMRSSDLGMNEKVRGQEGERWRVEGRGEAKQSLVGDFIITAIRTQPT